MEFFCKLVPEGAINKFCILGVGGGSDFETARLFSVALTQACADASVLLVTSLSPIPSQNETPGVDLDATVRKYTGKSYSRPSSPPECGLQTFNSNPLYSSNEVINRDGWPWIHMSTEDCNDIISLGFIVCPHEYESDFQRCQSAFTSTICSVLECSLNEITFIAVDTGGDALRGMVAGMGDRDISYLYDSRDTRDYDTLFLLKSIHLLDNVTLLVFGPGSDGETSQEGLETAMHELEQKGGDGRFIVGEVKQFESLWKSPSIQQLCPENGELIHRQLSGWSEPLKGSTISNILRAVDESDQKTLVPVERRGQVVSHIPASFMSSYWVLHSSLLSVLDD